MTMSSAKIGESLDSATSQLDCLAPSARSQPMVPCDEQAAEPTGPGQGGFELIDVPRKVLIVEPTSSERWWLRNELIAGQIEVFEANDLIMALRAIPMFQPNVILAQLRLPTYNGLELVRRLKQESVTQSIPVLLYADIATAEERVRAFDLGAIDFVSKPFVGAELLARVRAAFRTRHLLTMLEQRAHLDGLTGLANRGVLDDRLPREWEVCRRRGTSLAVVISDLDHFKSINDNHGHAAGDEVLRQSAARLGRVVRSSDLVARYGGEEFVVVAPDCELRAAVKLAERFRTAIAELGIVEHGEAIPVTTSVGVAATSDLARVPPAELLKQADEALYRAKDSGRDATWFWDQARGALAAAELLGAES
jgi:diguanylate cyclase (GGDEF)-like protein